VSRIPRGALADSSLFFLPPPVFFFCWVVWRTTATARRLRRRLRASPHWVCVLNALLTRRPRTTFVFFLPALRPEIPRVRAAPSQIPRVGMRWSPVAPLRGCPSARRNAAELTTRAALSRPLPREFAGSARVTCERCVSDARLAKIRSEKSPPILFLLSFLSLSNWTPFTSLSGTDRHFRFPVSAVEGTFASANFMIAREELRPSSLLTSRGLGPFHFAAICSNFRAANNPPCGI